jgi:hypothetical protein
MKINIYISEYNAPEDFVCIKEIKTYTALNRGKQDIRIEKLFIHESQLNIKRNKYFDF